PSRLACSSETESTTSAAWDRKSWTVGGSPNPSKKDAEFRIGKNSFVPEGMIIVRSAEPESLITPTRKVIPPLTNGWPLRASSPVSSKNGFSSTGSENTYCHHTAASSLYC